MGKLHLRGVTELKDRHGKTRYRFRLKRRKACYLPGSGPGDPVFDAAYQVALATPASGVAPTTLTTVDQLVSAYLISARYDALAKRTRDARRRILMRFAAQHGETLHAYWSPALITEKIETMMDRPAAAKNLVKALSAMWTWAVKAGHAEANPTMGVQRPSWTPTPIHSWTEEEIARFEAHWAVGTRERLAFALLLHLAQRQVDVCGLGPQHIIDGRYMRVRQSKTGAEIDVPIHTTLAACLRATPTGALVFLTTAHGASFSENGFRNAFARWVDAAALPARCTGHGLRKAGARRLAEAGCSAKQIMAVTGHKTLSEAEAYVRAAEQRLLADQAVARLPNAEVITLRTQIP